MHGAVNRGPHPGPYGPHPEPHGPHPELHGPHPGPHIVSMIEGFLGIIFVFRMDGCWSEGIWFDDEFDEIIFEGL